MLATFARILNIAECQRHMTCIASLQKRFQASRTSRDYGKRSSLSLAIGIVKCAQEAGVAPPEFANMLRRLKEMKNNKDTSKESLNQHISQILCAQSKRVTLETIDRSFKALEATTSVLMSFGILEHMCRDIIYNNPMLLRLDPEQLRSVCNELQASGVDTGDYASILAQHSRGCNAKDELQP